MARIRNRHLSTRIVGRGVKLLVLAGLLAAVGAANATVITDSDPGSPFITSPGDTLATFVFDLGGQIAESASVTFNDYDVAFVESAEFFLDGVSLGTRPFGTGQTFELALSDLSVLSDGSATLTWELDVYVAGCPCVIADGGETLTINARSVPEPATLFLLGLGAAALTVRRRKAGRG